MEIIQHYTRFSFVKVADLQSINIIDIIDYFKNNT